MASLNSLDPFRQVFCVVLTMRLILFALEMLSLQYGLMDVRGTNDTAVLVLLAASEADVVLRALTVGALGGPIMQAVCEGKDVIRPIKTVLWITTDARPGTNV